MKRIRRYICLITALALLVSGCGSVILEDNSGKEAAAQASEVREETPAPTASPAQTPAATKTPSPTPLPHEGNETAKVTVSATPEPTKTPEPTPAESSVAPIENEVAALIQNYGGEWSVYFQRLDTGESFCVNEMSMVAASLIKLYVYGTVMEQIEQGILPEGVYDDSLWYMITVSDNTSCNYLIDTVGFDAVNEFIERNGFIHSHLNRRMLEYNGSENYTSTIDCGHVIEQALRGTYVSEYTSGRLLEALRNSERTWKIPAGIPEGIVTGNKTGELDNIENDAAFVESPACTYVLCVMTAGVDSAAAIDQIAQLSAVVYSMLNNE